MSFWILLQVIIDLFVVAGLVGVWLKKSRNQKEDPRLSRGLQLLQTKISVLEDLGDRTETQVSQLTALLEGKVKELQTKILDADRQLQKIESATGKSLEVAKIFQDRIPHQEIIERQNTIKYVTAARLAHQGLEIEEIAKQVDLSRGELEFVVKVNRDNLQFSEEELPEWALEATPEMQPQSVKVENLSAFAPAAPATETTLAAPAPTEAEKISLSALGDRFRKAIDTKIEMPNSQMAQAQMPSAPMAAAKAAAAAFMAPRPIAVPAATPAVSAMPAPMPTLTPAKPAAPATQTAMNSKGVAVQVKKVVFPKVNMDATERFP